MRKPSPAMIVALLGLFVALGGTGIAATGGNFVLGHSNSATSTTSLSAPVGGRALQISNTSTSAGATALGLTAAAGHAPFAVNTSAKVANLNADRLDGIDSTGFVHGAGRELTGNGQVALGDEAAIFTHPTAPAFTVKILCPSDASEPSLELFNNSSATAEAVSSVVTGNGAFARHLTLGNGDWIDDGIFAAGGESTNNLRWYDGHTATVSIFVWALSNQVDPRNDGCYGQWDALVN